MNTKLNKSDWIVILFVCSVSIIFNTIDYYNDNNLLKEYLVDFSVNTALTIGIVLLFMFVLIPNFLVKKRRYFIFITLSLIAFLIAGIIDYTAGFWSGDNNWEKFPKGMNLVLECIFRLTDEVGILLGILLTKKFYEGQTEYVKIEKQQKENELKLLRSQIDPHFLFNNLNTLDSLIDTDAVKAKEYINRLSLIYRYLIQTKDAEVMELSKELEFAENYIFLIETRFGSDYDFTIEKQTDFNNKFIPTGAIQTLLENVVKHNKPKEKPVQATIFIDKNWLMVSNTKSIIKSKDTLGTGLQNLQARYKLLTDKKIEIVDLDDEFSVKIPIIQLSEDS